MQTNSRPILKWAAPVLASLDIERTLEFYCSRLGFTRVYQDAGVWGIVSRDDVYIHFWACSDYAEMQSQSVVHPNAPLENKPWGAREFGVLDEDGNLVTFAERRDIE